MSSTTRLEEGQEFTDVESQDKQFHFSCDVCSKLFRSKLALARHTKQHTSGFNDEASDETHIRKKHGKRFGTKLKNDNDTENQTKELTLSCHICEKVFMRKETLAKHMKRHTSAFFCKSCTQGFNDKASYEDHVQKRHEMIRFSCPICDKLFRQKRSLHYHILLHTGEPPLPMSISK